jgi:hypothetical protein
MELYDNLLARLELYCDTLEVARDAKDHEERVEALEEGLKILDSVVTDMTESEAELLRAVLNVHEHTIKLHRMAVEQGWQK